MKGALSHDYTALRENLQKFKKSAKTPEVGSLWKHYKGGVYKVKGYSLSEQNDKMIMILYQNHREPLPLPWNRPLNEFLGLNEQGVQRFTKVSEPDSVKRKSKKHSDDDVQSDDNEHKKKERKRKDTKRESSSSSESKEKKKRSKEK